IYAGTLTTGQVRDRIAAAAGLRADTTAEFIDGLSRHGTGALTVLIDALDEAADPRGLVSELLRPVMRDHRGALRLLLGTRPYLLTSQLLGKPESGRYVPLDLDSAAYADPASIRLHPADPAVRRPPGQRLQALRRVPDRADRHPGRRHRSNRP